MRSFKLFTTVFTALAVMMAMAMPSTATTFVSPDQDELQNQILDSQQSLNPGERELC